MLSRNRKRLRSVSDVQHTIGRSVFRSLVSFRNHQRRRRDSNPRCSSPHNGFQNRPLQPLGHASGLAEHVRGTLTSYHLSAALIPADEATVNHAGDSKAKGRDRKTPALCIRPRYSKAGRPSHHAGQRSFSLRQLRWRRTWSQLQALLLYFPEL